MLKPGTLLNERYEIIDQVGSGGMANVYKAKDQKLNRFVAVKVLKPEFSDDTNFVKKFREEAQACAGLSHPNIVNVYDVGNEGDVHYIVMELVEGITLKSYIERKGKLDVKEALGIAIQIARGLEAAHSNHIVHRDIKPQNVIISKDGKVKVTDFGIAKASNSNTIAVDTMGSVHYLSPEQARGGYSDEKSDIYSLGVTMYEMLSGRVPFNGDNTVSVALLHIQSEPIPLRELDPEIPVSVERIVQKCMQKKPERRYLSASALIDDLKKSIDNPNGNFVVIPTTRELDSATINISEEELDQINNPSNQTDEDYNNTFEDDNDLYDEDEYDDEYDDEYYDDEDQYDDEEDDQDYDENVVEEDADEIDPRMEKIGLIGTIVAAIIAAIVILYLLSKVFNLFPGGFEKETNEADISVTPTISQDVSPSPEAVGTFNMPHLLNLTLDDATRLLEQRSESEDLVITSTEDYSDTVDRGLVIEQYPREGTEVSSNGEVRLVISAGQEAFSVPNVVGYSDGQAVTVLTDADLKVVRDYQPHNSIEKDKVISSSPTAGSSVVKGDTVTIIISTGPEIVYVSVPNIVGRDINDARHLIDSSGLSAGTIAQDYSDAPIGEVISQRIQAGEQVQGGTAIDFTISQGPRPTPTPTTPPETTTQAPSETSEESTDDTDEG